VHGQRLSFRCSGALSDGRVCEAVLGKLFLDVQIDSLELEVLLVEVIYDAIHSHHLVTKMRYLRPHPHHYLQLFPVLFHSPFAPLVDVHV